MSESKYTAQRGGAFYEVTIFIGTNARTAGPAEFQQVRVHASNVFHAQIVARNIYGASFAFDAKKVME